jgi:hypothetical protein
MARISAPLGWPGRAILKNGVRARHHGDDPTWVLISPAGDLAQGLAQLECHGPVLGGQPDSVGRPLVAEA